MKSKLLIVSLLLLSACSAKDMQQTLDLINANIEQTQLSEQEVVAALKDALAQGISRGAGQAAALDGYYGNPMLRIEFPPAVSKVESALRDIGLGGEVDKFVMQLNRGAEQAASRAKPVFIKAITSMSIEDAFSILKGAPDAATQYLRKTTGAELRKEFAPIISSSLNETSATRNYADIVNRYNGLPLVRKVDPDLEAYASERAIDGLFLLVAQEEANIRANPAARASALLRRVFGSLD